MKSWTQERLAALYTVPTDDEFHSAFERAFASDDQLNVVINGDSIPREKLKEQIRAQRGAMLKADVKFDQLSEASVPFATLRIEFHDNIGSIFRLTQQR